MYVYSLLKKNESKNLEYVDLFAKPSVEPQDYSAKKMRMLPTIYQNWENLRWKNPYDRKQLHLPVEAANLGRQIR